jgi:hypothetical protein
VVVAGLVADDERLVGQPSPTPAVAHVPRVEPCGQRALGAGGFGG